MNNASIHKAKEIETAIAEGGYRCVYLPPYSPELKPIEQYWSKYSASIERQIMQH
ncbi:hypothetical protein DFQ30_010916 [Apophysomyces sp. BC1015]|nr:hypothetical protein DFQ30_010916 [Apophysomyces sp. BC1015]